MYAHTDTLYALIRNVIETFDFEIRNQATPFEIVLTLEKAGKHKEGVFIGFILLIETCFVFYSEF